MADFLFDVGTRFDEAAVDSFVAKVKRAFAQIASQGGVAGAPQLEEARSAATSGLAALREGGADQASVVRARRDLTEALRASAAALFDEVASSKRMSAAQTRAAEQLLQLSTATVTPRVPAVTSLSEAGAFLAERRERVFQNLSPIDVADRGVPGALKAAGAEAARMASLGVDAIAGETAESRKLRTLAAARVQTENLRAARARQALEAESEEAAAIVQRMVSERTLNRTLNARVAAEIRARGAAGEAGFEGTLFQRIQASTAQRQGAAPRLPSEFATLGQFVTSKALTTAGFAVAGVGLYGGIQSIKDAIEESAKLQEKLNGLRAQFKATDQEASFPQFRQAVLDIAQETGTAGSEVAALGPLFVGAFGGGARAAVELRDAVIGIKAGAFTKETAANTANALQSTFAELSKGGRAVQDITDQGLHLQNVFGVASDEILKGTAALGPTAKEVGLDFQQTSTIIAAATQATQQNGTQVAGLLTRVLPTLQEKGVQLLSLYQSIPALAPKAPELAESLSKGATGQAFIQILRDRESLSEGQRQLVLTTIAERRELEGVIPVYNQASKAINELDHGTNATGTTQQKFEEVMKSNAEQLKRVGEQFRQIGQDLLRAGLAGALHDAAIAAGAFLSVIGGLVKFLGDLNDLTGGWSGRLVEAVLLLKVIVPLAKALIETQKVSAVTGGISAALGFGAGRGALPTAGQTLSGGQIIPAGGTLGKIGGVGASLIGGLNPYAVVAIGSLAILQESQQENAEAKSAAEKKVKSASDQYLAKIVADKGPLGLKGSGLAKFLEDTGLAQGDAEFSAATEEINRRRAAAAKEQVDVVRAALEKAPREERRLTGGERTRLGSAEGLSRFAEAVPDADEGDTTLAASVLHDIADKGLGPKRLKGIVDKAAAGDKVYIGIVKILRDIYADRPGELQRLLDLVNQADPAAKEALDAGQAVGTAEQAVQDYQSGVASLGDTITTIQQNVDNLKLLAKGGNLEREKDLAKGLKVQSDFVDSRLREAADLKIQAAEASGEGPEASIRILTELSSKLTGPKAQFKAAHDILAAEQKLADDLKHAVDIPPEVRALLTEEQLDLSPEISTFESVYIRGIAGLGETFDRELAALVAGGKSINEAIRILLESQRRKLTAALSGISLFDVEALSQYAGALDSINAAEAHIPTGDDVGPGVPLQAVPGAAKAPSASEAAAARRALAKAQAHGDPVLLAQNELDEANRELAEALNPADVDKANARILESQDALSKAQQDISKSRLSLAKALVSEDPVAAARIGKQEADAAVANAIGTAAQVEAQAQQINADRTLQKAIADVFNSQTELAIAVANAAGDSVKAAQLGAREAQDKIAQARARGAGDAEINQLQAQLVSANAGIVSAQLSEAEQNVDFALQMGLITTQAAIAILKGYLKVVAGNVDLTQSLLLKIKQLETQASQDLQFNIPKEIQLPTLYEARRLNQSGGNPGAYQNNRYQDNRQITLEMNVNSQTDYQAAFDAFRGIAVEPGLQYGTQGSLYSGA